MLFYTVGELFLEAAEKNARLNIKKALLDVRSKTATVYRNGDYVVVAAITKT